MEILLKTMEGRRSSFFLFCCIISSFEACRWSFVDGPTRPRRPAKSYVSLFRFRTPAFSLVLATQLPATSNLSRTPYDAIAVAVDDVSAYYITWDLRHSKYTFHAST